MDVVEFSLWTLKVVGKAAKDITGVGGDAFDGRLLMKVASAVTGGIGKQDLEEMLILESD